MRDDRAQPEVPEPKLYEPMSDALHSTFHWGVPISAKRQSELQSLAARQRKWISQPEAIRGDSPLSRVHLTGADVFWLAEESGYNEAGVPNLHLEGAFLAGAHLQEAILLFSNLRDTNFFSAHLEGADLTETDLEAANLMYAHLEGASLHGARLDSRTQLTEIAITNSTSLGDIHWNGVGAVDLTQVKWTDVSRLGEETRLKQEEMQLKHSAWAKHGAWAKSEWADRYEEAARAYRHLAAQLRAQGLTAVADRFNYRAQVLQRQVLRRQGHPFRALFLWFLDMIAGHGYKPERSLIAYLFAIFGFGIAYYVIGQAVGPHLSPLGAFVFSMTCFHGRGFFPGGIALDDPMTVIAAFEAFVGLVIEVSFIATFTQRFFGR